jgi:hypothetical protein
VVCTSRFGIISPTEFADRSFIEELDKTGFIKKLYEK